MRVAISLVAALALLAEPFLTYAGTAPDLQAPDSCFKYSVRRRSWSAFYSLSPANATIGMPPGRRYQSTIKPAQSFQLVIPL